MHGAEKTVWCSHKTKQNEQNILTSSKLYVTVLRQLKEQMKHVHGGVVSAFLRGMSTNPAYGLACLKSRDSCMAAAVRKSKEDP